VGGLRPGGKGDRTRTVLMPSWAMAAIDEWAWEASVKEGRIFRRMHKGGYVGGDWMSAQAVVDVVRSTPSGVGSAIWRPTTCGGPSPSWPTRVGQDWSRSSGAWDMSASGPLSASWMLSRT